MPVPSTPCALHPVDALQCDALAGGVTDPWSSGLSAWAIVPVPSSPASERVPPDSGTKPSSVPWSESTALHDQARGLGLPAEGRPVHARTGA